MRKSVYDIFNLISTEPGTNKKMEILESFKANPVLKRALYLATSKRVKFYLKQIPSYTPDAGPRDEKSMPWALAELDKLSNRTVTGTAASDYLKGILSKLTKDDAYIIERIIEKDPKIGMGTTNINKIFPDLVEETPYMGAIAYNIDRAKDIFKNGARGLSQIKMDGRYLNAIVNHSVVGVVDAVSRAGEDNMLEGAAFIEELKKFQNCVLNGELTIDGIKRTVSNGIIASLVDINKKIRAGENVVSKVAAFEKEKGMSYKEALSKVRYTVWDVISLEEYNDNESKVPYFKRLEAVKRLIAKNNSKMVSLIYTREVASFEEAMDHFQEALKAGEEGTVLKAYDGGWKDGKPNWQVKMKLVMNIDLKITGFNYGTGKNAKVISSLNCESSDGIVKCSPTGIKEKMMKYITDNQSKLLGAIVECKCCGLSSDSLGNWSVFYPGFIEIRDDKKTCDDFKSIKKIEDGAKGLTAALTK